MRFRQTGMSLVELMVGIAVGAVLSYGVARMINEMVRGQRHIEFGAASQSLRNDVIKNLSNREACRRTFGGVNPVTNLPVRTQILLSSGTVFREIYSLNQRSYESGRVRINRIAFPLVPNPTYRPIGADPLRGTADFNLELFDQGAASAQKVEQIALSVELDASNNIVSCVALGNDESSIWKLNGPFAYYDGGEYVGIGTENPETELDVIGPIHSSGTMESNRLEAPLITTEVDAVTQGFIDSFECRAEAFEYASDRKLKTNIRAIESQNLFSKLVPVSFRWISDERFSFGLIAQDVKKIYPEAVSTLSTGGKLGIDYSQIVSLYIEEIKALDQKRTELNQRLLNLEMKRKALVKGP